MRWDLETSTMIMMMFAIDQKIIEAFALIFTTGRSISPNTGTGEGLLD